MDQEMCEMAECLSVSGVDAAVDMRVVSVPPDDGMENGGQEST